MIDQTLPLGSGERVWLNWRVALLLFAAVLLATSWLVNPAYALVAWAALCAAALILRYPVFGFCLLAFAVPWGTFMSVTIVSVSIGPGDVIVGIIGVVWAVAIAEGGKKAFGWNRWTPYLLAFVLVVALSSTQASDWHASVREVIKWLELLVVFQAGVGLLQTDDVPWVTLAVVGAGVSQALLGYAQAAFQLGPQAFAHGAFLRAYGSFDQPNPYAGYINIVFALSLSLAIAPEAGRSRLGYRVATLLLAGALLASQSRGALLATVAAASVVLACRSPSWKALVWLSIFVLSLGGWLASLGLIPSGPFARLLSAVGLGDVSFGNVNDANFSAVERAAHWLAGVRIFAAHPILGVGIGNYAVAYPKYHPRGWYAALAHAHNYYINIAAEAGVVGLIVYALLAGSALWYSYAAMRRCRGTFGSAVALGVLGALVATDFHNVFDVLYVHGMVVLLGILMTMVATEHAASDQLPRPELNRGQ